MRAVDGDGADTRLTTFLYLLARDHLPVGAIEKAVLEAEVAAKRKVVVFSEPNLHAWAAGVADRLDA